MEKGKKKGIGREKKGCAVLWAMFHVPTLHFPIAIAAVSTSDPLDASPSSSIKVRAEPLPYPHDIISRCM